MTTDLTERDKELIVILPETEYGQALFKWLRSEIAMQEEKELHGSKICDDPLFEDFRTQLGIKIGLKWVLNLPTKILEESNNKRET